MLRSKCLSRCAIAVCLMLGGRALPAEEIGTAVDLTTFGAAEADSAPAAVWDDVPVEEVAEQWVATPRRFYLSRTIGASFANVWNPGVANSGSEDTIIAAGGALGIAFDRAQGQLRFEVEGTGRGTYDAPYFSQPGDTILTNNWSLMGNVWRDVMITDRFGIYAGAGIGGGGYVLSDRIDDVVQKYGVGSAFAWQGGGGLLWEISERFTFDVGYRYFRFDTIRVGGAAPSEFGTSELMFTVRLYEPFQRWRR